MGLPLDDSYIYLTYAKQFGRAQPFTYFPAAATPPARRACCGRCCSRRSGRSARAATRSCGCRSACAPRSTRRRRARLLPVRRARSPAIAPRASLARGARRSRSRRSRGRALSGMEVAFASALLVATLLLLATRRRPAAAVEAARRVPRGDVAVAARGDADRRRDRRRRASRRRGCASATGAPRRGGCVPLAAPLAWLIANKLLAGNFFPNTGVAKSHFYLPGFDWTYWWRRGRRRRPARCSKRCSGTATSPLVWPRLVGDRVARRRGPRDRVGAARARAGSSASRSSSRRSR